MGSDQHAPAALAAIGRRMAAHRPRIWTGEDKVPAAVAAVLCERAGEPCLLFIERAEFEGDPWSGHIAFPGGRLEPHDREARAAAERETLEEVGLDLSAASYVGRLDDLTGEALPVAVAGFVYVVEHPGALEVNSEVRQAFWVPLSQLVEPARQVVHARAADGGSGVSPAIDLLGPGRPLLWGITYRFVAQLLRLAGGEEV